MKKRNKKINKSINKSINKKIILIFMIIILIFGITKKSIAASSEVIEVEKFTDDFKNYIKLSEDEKKNVLMPLPYTINNTNYKSSNPFVLLSANPAETTFNLKSLIPNNLKIRNQLSTNECWCFSSLSSLETNLALTNGDNKVYDFSERHLDYYTSRTFLNGEINEFGFNREVSDGGSNFLTTAYLTNGSGAILEEDMPFENNIDKIALSDIQGKKVASQVYDIKSFPTYTVDEGNTTEVRNEIKSYIKQYGSIMAQIYGAALLSEYTNNATGAMYCDNAENCPINHAVAIVGWDDEYTIDNFNEEHRPLNKGAWIVRNSWGEKIEYNLTNLKQQLYRAYRKSYIREGKTNYTMLTNEDVEKKGFSIEGDKAYLNVGDNGFMYISYEDVNIYTNLYGVQKSADSIDYENIYQHNFYGSNAKLLYNTSKIYLGEIFTRKSTTKKEYLTQVSISNPETYTCKVYVNPNGSSMAKNDLQEVKLKAGESETFDSGYHTLEFETPIELKSKDFSVVVEIQSNSSEKLGVLIEYKNDQTFNQVTIDEGTSFTASEQGFNKNIWTDLSNLTELYPNNNLLDGDATIKAFTTTSYEDASLKEIKITTAPNKTTYIEEEDFDKTGMVVTAYYNNDTYANILDYDISEGTRLKLGQTSVKISYQGKTIEQKITVNVKPQQEANVKKVKGIEISNIPNKTVYIQNKDNLDLAGGSIKVTYTDGTTENIDLKSNKIQVSGFSNANLGTQKVTISYEGFTTSYMVEIVSKIADDSIKIRIPEEKVVIEVPKDEANSSDLSNIRVNVLSQHNYTYLNGKEDFVLLDVIVSGLKKSSDNDRFEYYYYLSPNSNENNIQNWVRISEYQSDISNLQFTVNSEDIKNYEELQRADKVYMYLREIAIKGGNQKVKISTPVLFKNSESTTIKNYLNDNIQADKTNDINSVGKNNEENNNSALTQSSNLNNKEVKLAQETKKTSPKVLPYTGNKGIITIIILFILIAGTMFVKYKKYKI